MTYCLIADIGGTNIRLYLSHYS